MDSSSKHPAIWGMDLQRFLEIAVDDVLHFKYLPSNIWLMENGTSEFVDEWFIMIYNDL